MSTTGYSLAFHNKSLGDWDVFGIGSNTEHPDWETTSGDINTYIPITSISRTPAGQGTTYQKPNLLSPYRRNTFVADGTSTTYQLDTDSIQSVYTIKVNGTVLPETEGTTTNWVGYNNGQVVFTTPPSAPDTEGEDNIEIVYRKYKYHQGSGSQITDDWDKVKDKIFKCTLSISFDDRAFLTGNPDYPNVIFYSALDDPTYFPDNNWMKAGTDSGRIMAITTGNNALWVFKETNKNDTSIFFFTPATNPDTGDTYYYPQHSTIQKGCVSKAGNFADDICMFTSDGLDGISGDLSSEKVLGHRSSMVDSKMLSEAKYLKPQVAEWNGYLCIAMGTHMYVADSRQKFQNEAGDIEYEWYYWDFVDELSTGDYITFIKNINNVLYLGTYYGKTYTLTGSKYIKSYWTTALDDMNYPNYRKVTNKRGCMLNATGWRLELYAKTNNDSDFVLIDQYLGSSSTGYIVPRIKEKKWKEIQFRFESDRYLSLYDMTIESYVGGYVKR